MLVTGFPQFPTQDDNGLGDGIDPTSQWQVVSSVTPDAPGHDFTSNDLDPAMVAMISRLRAIFSHQGETPLTSTDLHDLTLFVVHKLLLLPPFLPAVTPRTLISECLRSAIVLYMLIIHGTTYYSLQVIITMVLYKLEANLKSLTLPERHEHRALRIWILMVAMTASPSPLLKCAFAAYELCIVEIQGWQSWRP